MHTYGAATLIQSWTRGFVCIPDCSVILGCTSLHVDLSDNVQTTNTRTRTHARIHRQAHSHAHLHAYTDKHIHTRTYSRRLAQASTHTRRDTHTCTNPHSFVSFHVEIRFWSADKFNYPAWGLSTLLKLFQVTSIISKSSYVSVAVRKERRGPVWALINKKIIHDHETCFNIAQQVFINN